MICLSLYRLARKDSIQLRLTDSYSIHRAVYDLFDPVRIAGEQDHSGILYADKGEEHQERRILILSNRFPRTPSCGILETRNIQDSYLDFPSYRFEIVINPVRRNAQTRKLIPVRGSGAVARWFVDKSSSWGFTVEEKNLQLVEVFVDNFFKKGVKVTLGKARLTGVLHVSDRQQFLQSFYRGIGRGRAFGCGLLQLVPCV